MNRIQDYAKIAGRTLTRTPLPDWAYSTAFGKVRIPVPGGKVAKRHAVDVELINRTRVVWLDRHKAAAGIVIYLHGGGYSAGPFTGEWQWLSQQVDGRECAGLMIDYRYGPDYVHPTALDDSQAVIDELKPINWVIAGHQSGCGLALALVGRLEPEARPSGLVLMNPWLDLEMSNLELAETETHDPVHERRYWKLSAQGYAGRAELADPELSPVNSHFSQLPPIHFSVGTKDIFLTDSRVVKLQLEQAGCALTYREIGGRISVTPWLRRGADMDRLMREQAVFTERALG